MLKFVSRSHQKPTDPSVYPDRWEEWRGAENKVATAAAVCRQAGELAVLGSILLQQYSNQFDWLESFRTD